MRYDSRHDAQTLRGKSVGPAALMRRRALQPFIPNRGLSAIAVDTVPARRRVSLGYLGATSTVGDAAAGASIGSKIGTSVAGPIGTAVGAIVGAVGGVVFAAFNRQDQEVQNFNQAQQMANAQGPTAVLNVANKYLVIAGLFDLESSQIKGNIPFYKKYGRMGEQKFISDMMNLIYTAAQNGQITANDTAETIYSSIVIPWMNSWGLGSLNDSNSAMLSYTIMGMIAEYVAGLQTRWRARAGDYPFGNLPAFALRVAATPALAPASVANTAVPTASAQPTPSAAASVPAELQRYLSGQLPGTNMPINYARDAVTGSFVQLPAGGNFGGVSTSGVWYVNYPTGEYTVQNGVLTPVQPVTPAASSGASSSASTSTDVGSSATQPVYYPSTGGGYVAPDVAPTTSVSTPQTAVPQGQSFPTWIAVGGAALLVVVLLNKRKSR